MLATSRRSQPNLSATFATCLGLQLFLVAKRSPGDCNVCVTRARQHVFPPRIINIKYCAIFKQLLKSKKITKRRFVLLVRHFNRRLGLKAEYRCTDHVLNKTVRRKKYSCVLRWPKWFILLLRYEFSIPNSEFRILNSEFRIPNSAFRKKMLCMELMFLEMPHQGPCTGWGKRSKIRTIQTIV